LDRKQDDPPTVCVQDAKSAMRWVRAKAKEFGIDPNRIASAGGSAGGHLAAFVGTVEGGDAATDDLTVSPKSNAMLLFNPVYDNGPGGWGTARVGDRYPEFSPAHNLSEDDPPSIVFLGSQDDLVPVSTAERFRDRCIALGVDSELHVYEGQGHGFFNHGRDQNKWYRKTVIAADRFLAGSGWIRGEPTLSQAGAETP
jgi:acetyl esterase/lipase